MAITETKTDAYYRALGVDTDNPDWQALTDEEKALVIDDSYWDAQDDDDDNKNRAIKSEP